MLAASTVTIAEWRAQWEEGVSAKTVVAVAGGIAADSIRQDAGAEIGKVFLVRNEIQVVTVTEEVGTLLTAQGEEALSSYKGKSRRPGSSWRSDWSCCGCIGTWHGTWHGA